MGKRLILKRSGYDEEVISIDFTEELASRLKLFSEKSKRLFGLTLFKQEIPFKVILSWDKERSLQVSGDCPDDETIGLLLHNLRPFILNDEKTFLPKISNIIAKEIDNIWVRDLLKDIKYLWSGGALSGTVQITMMMKSDGQKVQEKILTDNFLNKWLNAYEYHSDSDKRSLIEGLHKYYPIEGTKLLLVGLLLEKVKAIHRLSKFIDLVMCDKSVKSLNVSIGRRN